MEVVWGVIYLLGVGLSGTGWVIYYILRMAYLEMNNGDELQDYRGDENGRDDFGYNPGNPYSSSTE